MHTTSKQPLSFVLTASAHGPLIVSRFDFNPTGNGGAYGVGGQILQTSAYQPEEIKLVLALLTVRRKHHGDGVLAFDCGANIGVHTVEWARHMTGWGRVVAIEPQERLYYALAGNIALNNCFNATAIHAAVSITNGFMDCPILDYQVPSSFGSLELKQHEQNEPIGQPIDYGKVHSINKVCIDGLDLPRLDFLKLDVQRMELQALDGAFKTILKYHPIILVEMTDVGEAKICEWFDGSRYLVKPAGPENLLAIHEDDPALGDVKWSGDGS